MHGLNQYDYSARYYDPAISRFTTMDPMAEKYYSISPYVYVGNNPMRFIDPDGRDIWSTNDPKQIERFFTHLQSVANRETFDAFNYDGWQQMSNDVYKKANKDNTIAYDDNRLNFNINLDDFKANFNIKIGSKDSKEAYVDYYDLENAFGMNNDESNEDLFTNHLVGPTLVLLGQPIKALKPIGALGSKPGSSIASYTLSKVIPTRFTKILGKSIGTKVAKQLGTNTIGRALGRGVPYLGWMWTAWDVGRILGENYGGDAWVREYKESKK